MAIGACNNSINNIGDYEPDTQDVLALANDSQPCPDFSGVGNFFSKHLHYHEGQDPYPDINIDVEPYVNNHLPTLVNVSVRQAIEDALADANYTGSLVSHYGDLGIALLSAGPDSIAINTAVNNFNSEYCRWLQNVSNPIADHVELEKSVMATSETLRSLALHYAQYEYNENAGLESRSGAPPCWVWEVGGAVIGAVVGTVLAAPSGPAALIVGAKAAVKGASLGLSVGKLLGLATNCSKSGGPECNPVTRVVFAPSFSGSCNQGTFAAFGGGKDLNVYEWDNASVSPINDITFVPRLDVAANSLDDEMSTLLSTNCDGNSSVPNDNDPFSLGSIRSARQDLALSWYSVGHDNNNFSMQSGTTMAFYALAHPSPSLNDFVDISVTSSTPYIASVSPGPSGFWWDFEVTATGVGGSTDITATLTETCTGATISQKITVGVY